MLFRSATIQNNEILPLNQKDPSSVAMLSELELAPNDYTEYVRNLLAEKLLMFSYRTCDLIERYDPNAFDMVHFHGPGMEGIGVYKGKVGDGFQMCCYTLLGKDKTTKYSSSEIIPNYNSFVFWKTTTSEETKLRRRLEKFGKRWNKPCNRIEPVGYGDDINKCYFYITEAMEVKECTDTKERKFTERRKGGNVFRKKEDAVIILGLFRDIINKFLAEDQAE